MKPSTIRDADSQNLLKWISIAIGLTAILTALTVISLLVALFGDLLVGAGFVGAGWPSKSIALAWVIARWPLALGTLFAALAVVYHFAPNLKGRPWRWITPGSVFGVILLAVVSIGLRLYVHFSQTYTTAYGSLGAVIVLLVSFYLAGIAILSGGVLNGVLERLRDKRRLADNQSR